MVHQEERKKKKKEVAARRKIDTRNQLREGKKFFTGAGEVTKAEFRNEKRRTGTASDPALARRTEREGEAFKSVAQEIIPVAPVAPTEPQQVQQVQETEEPQRQGLLDIAKEIAFGNVIETNPFTGQPNINPATGQPVESLLGVAPIGLAGAGFGAFKVGKEVISNPTKVIQAGNAARNTGVITNALRRMKEFPLISGAAGAIIASTVAGFLDSIGEKQQALNTLGQVATTIEGEATESSGDWRKGIKEIDNIEQRILELASNIKSSGIASQTIKVDGRIFDINADIEDQLRTLSEARSRIVSFVLEGNFPELEPFEIQEKLRELEEGGFIEPVDFEEARRET